MNHGHGITTVIMLVLAAIGFVVVTVGNNRNADEARENKQRYKMEIRAATKECLDSVRGIQQVQNFNANEIVNSCNEYALKLYGAKY
ncbi:TPA: hypothetical protein LUC71_002571 [Acinetobacter baumannii]|uniref:DUF4461 domain-containing protein n=1 Tax=Acinetobacter baumannii TaxID=470 RepID=UPI0013C5CDBF|nr:DUF4461 domain-containing protein [Acinetobacter baumannii]NDW25412.1 DUF4461 domain-containing protein [Acinetobacter baumannii]HBM1135829.1 hypothetical protein [Acinetobacter baumannii]